MSFKQTEDYHFVNFDEIISDASVVRCPCTDPVSLIEFHVCERE